MPDGTLRDLGERRIVEEILRSRYAQNALNYGDDCALLPIGLDGKYVTMTTDPCPHPVADLLGFADYYYWGWLLATINLSDLAAAGAQPIGLLTSFTLPPAMLISDFTRMLDGVDECCSTVGARVVGGNLREGPQIALSGSAVGICDTLPMSRAGIQAGDHLVIIGDLGNFWGRVFHAYQRNRFAAGSSCSTSQKCSYPLPESPCRCRAKTIKGHACVHRQF